MKKFVLLFIIFSSILMTSSCNTLPPSTISPRIITIDNKQYTESEYTIWRCYKNLLSSKVLVEVGHLTNQEADMNGFILFEGGNVGKLVSHKRAGLNLRWNWDKAGEKYKYAFVIDPEGNGAYYDFSSSNNNVQQDAKQTYKCKK